MKYPESDLTFVASVLADRPEEVLLLVEKLRHPDFLEVALEDDRLVERIRTDPDITLKISPRLLFNILLRRVARDIRHARYTLERVGLTQSVPVFDTHRVNVLLEDEQVLEYLSAMLASFVRTETYVLYVRRGNRLERLRFSDMDMDDMIRLADLVDEAWRFPLLRRIADIALFLTGIFPSYVLSRGMYAQRMRPGRVIGGEWRSLEEYEQEGATFYRRAAEHEQAIASGLRPVLNKLSEHFSSARKPLNLLSDRYLRWRHLRLFHLPG
ncbi:MAG: hypothetical protein QN140_06325 [Armatimonadota bacterium]|nr:hypothetical protein [Armatimonadota bacterium]MDR7439331.1 hypothetical protein [Armatimonadota bacterium]MDR7562021.1 hypothetical protein [Armatimonadota bacterium]MDR7567005.1 hypothetical protein [Armatimonadota bacterium]